MQLRKDISILERLRWADKEMLMLIVDLSLNRFRGEKQKKPYCQVECALFVSQCGSQKALISQSTASRVCTSRSEALELITKVFSHILLLRRSICLVTLQVMYSCLLRVLMVAYAFVVVCSLVSNTSQCLISPEMHPPRKEDSVESRTQMPI